MNTLSRRRFLLLGGASIGVAVVSGVALAVRPLMQSGRESTVTFQAVAGLPQAPLPSYASYVIEGHVNNDRRTGTVTKTVFAGSPQERQPVALLTRTIRVTDVQNHAGSLSVTGVVNPGSGLQKGEGSAFQIAFDSSHQLAYTDFFGSAIQLRVEKWEESVQ